MRVYRSLEQARGRFDGSVVTIGNFDGVHRGHRVILDRLAADARERGSDAVVLTFDPHPIAVLRPDLAPQRLMTLADRLRALKGTGPDAVVVQRFSAAFAAIEARDFVERFLVENLRASKLLVGHDLNFGRARTGSVDTLIEAGGRHGFAVEVIGPVEVDGTVVHSSVVRRAVAAGDVALASRWLGRPHVVRGRVVRGEGRGRGLGFATANVRPRTELIPPEGVYATRVEVGGRLLDSVTSIGHTPTFGGSRTVIEAHIFEEVGDIYEATVGVRFVEHIRSQQKFGSVDELQARVALDIEEAHRRLARNPPAPPGP